MKERLRSGIGIVPACSLSALALIERFDSRLARGLLDVFYDTERPPGTQESALDALLMLDGMSSVEIVRAMEGDPAAAQQRAEAVAKRLEAQIARTVDN